MGNFKENEVYLCSKKSSEIIDVLKHLTNGLKREGIYVTLEEPFDKLISALKSEAIDDSYLFFVDVTFKAKGISYHKCYFVQNRTDMLTEMSIAITNAINTGMFNFLYFDNMAVLHNAVAENEFKNFISYLANKVKSYNMTSIFITGKEGNADLRRTSIKNLYK